MMNAKKLTAVLLSALLVSSLGACSSGGSQSSSAAPAAGESSSSQAAPAAGAEQASGELKGQFSYWMHNGPAFVEANKTLIEAFQKENPGVKIEQQVVPYDVLEQKTKTVYAAGNAPDALQGFGAWFGSLMRNNLLDEVPARLTENAEEIYYAPAIGGVEMDGKYYGIPREVNVEYGVLYYPEDLKAAGADAIPATMEEFLPIAQKMTQKDAGGNVTKAGFETYNMDGSFFLLLDWIIQQGGSYLEEDGIHVKLTTPEAEKAFQMLVDLNSGANAVADIKRITPQDNIEQLFFKGRSAAAMKGPWCCALGAEYGVDNFEFAVMPTFAGDKSLFVCEPGWAEVVAANSKNKDLAWAYIEFATNEENAAAFDKAVGSIPARRAIAEDESYQNDPANAKMKAAFAMMENSRAIGSLMDSSSMKSAVLKNLEKACKGELSSADALAAIEKDVNAQFEKLAAQTGA